MLRVIKHYWAFTKLGYRLVVFILMPGVILLMSWFCIATGMPLMMSLLLGFLYMLPVDVLTDHWFLGGFYVKNNSSLEYLQSSNRFSRLIRDVVLIDILRRFALYVGSYLIIILMAMQDEAQMYWVRMCSYMPLVGFAGVQLSLLVARHFVIWNQAYACGAIALLLVALSTIPMMKFVAMNLWVAQGTLLVFAVVVSVILMAYSMKKVRDSYYDK